MDADTAADLEAERWQQQQQQQQRPSSPDPFWIVPFDRNISFVGRNETFTEIDQAFEVKDDSQPRAALCGLGGIGKSQVALEYCFRRRSKDAKCSVFWVNAATVARFEESLNRIASECNISAPDGAKYDAALLLKDWLEVEHIGPWLMIIDNVDDENTFFRGKMSIGKSPSECIPNCQTGSLLFTTRNRKIASDVANPTKPIVIHELGKTEGLELVKKQLGDTEPDNTILGLLEELDYTPLAITQAVAFMVKEHMSVQQYLEQYRKNGTAKSTLPNHEFSDQPRPEDTPESVAKTWKLSFEAIRNSNRKAADLLCLINFFQHHGIPAILLQDADEPGESSHLQEATDLLKAFSIIDENDSVFSTHRLVQLATRWWLEEENPQDVDKWAFQALKSITSQFPAPSSQPGSDYFKLGEILLPHAEWILQYQFKTATKDSEITRAKLLASTGRFIHWNGNYDEARSRFKESFEINYQHLGEKHVDTLVSMGLLGWTLATFDQDLLGLPVLKQVVEYRREILGEDDPMTIDSLSDLATAILLTGDYAESEKMQREALARSEQVLGLKHNDTLNCMAHLASVLDEQGKTEEAEKMALKTYELKRELLGHLHPDTLVAEHNVAYMLSQDDEKVDEALSLYRHSLRNKSEVLGLAHNETLITAYNLISYLASNDRVSEARALCEKYIAEAGDILQRKNTRTQEWLNKFEAVRDNLAESAGNE
ncbi:P-loop containing nucleoside triphosphate hydrolase protein [Trichoderma sp. SZMC 28015]